MYYAALSSANTNSGEEKRRDSKKPGKKAVSSSHRSDNPEQDASSQPEPRVSLAGRSITSPSSAGRPSLAKHLGVRRTNKSRAAATAPRSEAGTNPVTNDRMLNKIAAILESEAEEANNIRQFVIDIQNTESDAVSRITTDTALRSHYEGGMRDRLPSFDVIAEMEGSNKDWEGTYIASPRPLFAITDDDNEILGSSAEWGSGSQPSSALFTFQRRAEGVVEPYCVTLNGKCIGEEEETMADLVKRLQEKESPILRFDYEEKLALGCGEKEVMFALTQVSNTKFGKAEFGRMTTSEILSLTTERPVLIEIQTQTVLHGENVDLF